MPCLLSYHYTCIYAFLKGYSWWASINSLQGTSLSWIQHKDNYWVEKMLTFWLLSSNFQREIVFLARFSAHVCVGICYLIPSVCVCVCACSCRYFMDFRIAVPDEYPGKAVEWVHWNVWDVWPPLWFYFLCILYTGCWAVDWRLRSATFLQAFCWSSEAILLSY